MAESGAPVAFKNLMRTSVCGGHNLPPLVEIWLRSLPKLGGETIGGGEGSIGVALLLLTFSTIFASMNQYFIDKLSLFLTDVIFDNSEGN